MGKDGNYKSFEGTYLNGKYWNGKGKNYKRWSHGRSYLDIEFNNGKTTKIGKEKFCE